MVASVIVSDNQVTRLPLRRRLFVAWEQLKRRQPAPSPAASPRKSLAPLFVLIAAWVGVFLSLILLDHFTLRTNGFDLSVFDYALWLDYHGPRLGFIPFYHLSLSSFT